MCCLGANDRFSLVTFHTTARTVFTLLPMTAEGAMMSLLPYDVTTSL